MSDPAAAPTLTAVPGTTLRYEGVWRRFLATLMDNAVWLLFVWFYLSWIFATAGETLAAILSLVLLTAWFNYFAIAEWRWGQTIGKAVLGLRVTTEAGERPGWNAAAIRNVLRIVDFAGVGALLIVSSERRQRLGDRLAHTVVVSASADGAPAAAPAPATAAASDPPPQPATVPQAPPQQTHAVEPEPGGGAGIAPGGWTPLTVVMAVLAVIIASLVEVVGVAAFDPELESTSATLAVQGLLAATLVAVAVGFASATSTGSPLSALGLRRCKWSALGLGLATFLGYIVFAALYASLVQPEQEDLTRDLGFDEGGLAAVFAGVLIIAAAPLSEEVFFRGFMFPGLRRRMSLWPAAAIAGIVFGALHYTGPDSLGVVPQLAVFGMLLAWLYEYTGSLWPPILVHVLNNAIAFVIVTTT